ncbi:SCO6745 family protein [Pseudonocardia endophytica]|uniref:SalK n=1 Tax=Pseudonocardia endophytica TaxID=401976 RepID=A0A4R1HKB4_PSEEN|nr:hypothetical protein [Pseudonocardia endophytica]TCK22834.1 hypothetical protein EV378_6845 [Pseudonocardia endophytica]
MSRPQAFTTSVPDDVLSRNARALRGAVEPIAAQVYFAPEVHDAFAALGFTRGDPGGPGEGYLHLPDLAAYFCSRAGCMGRVPGEVVASVFGVFDPAVVVPETGRGWATAPHPEIMEARERGATAAMERILGPLGDPARATDLLLRAAMAGRVSGRPLFAGLRSLPMPAAPWGALWRAADMVREHRGDAHVAAWTAAGLDPVEAGLLAEVYADMPRRRYHLTRGWPEATLDEGLDRLRDKGLVRGEPAVFTDEGAALREAIEVATDVQQAPLLDALGDQLDELLALLRPWCAAIVAAGAYPSAIEQLPPTWGRPPW